MSQLRAWLVRLGGLFRRERSERELAEEIESHLQMHIEDNLRAGMTPEEARRQALIKLGGVEQTKETYREQRSLPFLETLWQDVRFGARQLGKNPGFTIVAVLTLALGIGATTAIFSVVKPILFESLPYPQADRVMAIWDLGVDGSRLDVAFGTYREVAERSRSFNALAALKPWQPTLTGRAEPERLEGQRVSASYFRVLGTPPALGRPFDLSDDKLNGPRVAILSHGLWRRRFQGDLGIIGHQITLDGQNYEVIGVMPGAFENVLSPSAELWAPLQYDMSQVRAWGHHLRMVGRLQPGVTVEQAAREIDGIAHAPVPEFPRVPWASLRQGLLLNSLQEEVTRGVKPALLAVLGAVILLLVIACVNLTNLFLARGVRRRGEFALRTALGAARPRILLQLLIESLLFAALGGVFGMVVADFGVRVLVALSPPGLPRTDAIRVDGTVLAFGFCLTTLIGIVVGLIPAVRASRDEPHRALQQSSRRATGGDQFMRRALVVGEVALALVLLVSAGLLFRSLERLFAISPGFDASDRLTMQVQTSGRRFDQGATNQFFSQSLEAVRQVPGVAAAAFSSQLPLSGDYNEYGLFLESSPESKSEGAYPAFRYAVSPGYFEAMGIPLRRGRLLDSHDTTGTQMVALISESLAMKFPGADPIGQRVHIGPTDTPWYTIVGVVGNVKQMSLAESRADAVYVTPEQWHFADSAQWLVVRARRDALALAPAIKRAIWSVDKDQPIVRVARMDDLLAGSQADRRFALIVFEAFALAALVLVAVGIYGVIAGSVAERTHEIGVRSALGATRGDILALILGQGIQLTGLGIAIGMGAAVGASQAIAAMLFRVSPFDPATYLGVIVLLLGVSGIACWIPAKRASQVDPMVALRHE